MTLWLNPVGITLYQIEQVRWRRWQGERQPVVLSLAERATPLLQWERGYDARYCGACAVFVIVQRTDDGQYPCPECGAATEDRELPW